MSGLKDKTERLTSADFQRIAARSGNGSARVITTAGALPVNAPALAPGPKTKGRKKHTPEERRQLDKLAELDKAKTEERRRILQAELGTEVVAEYEFCPDRKWRNDFYLPAHQIAIEVEGGAWTSGRHTRGKGYTNDMAKYNQAQLMGIRVFRFIPDELLTNNTFTFLLKALHNVSTTKTETNPNPNPG